MTTETTPYLSQSVPPAPGLSAALLHASSRILFRSICSSLLLVSPDGRVHFANQSAEELLGCSSDALAGVHFESLCEPEDELANVSVGTRVYTGAPGATRTATRRVKLLCSNGLKLPARVNMRAVQDETGEEIGHVVTIEDLSDYVQMSEYVDLMAHHDLQTGLPKMATILSRVDQAILRLHGSGMSFALVQIGIDHFRRINESLGHDAGNTALREIGKRLCTKLECTDVLTRSSGDGFVALFTECPTQEEAMRRASEMMRTFAEPFKINDYCVRITASFGMSYGKGCKVTQNSSFTECEMALRRSKSLGGNHVTCFDPTMADWHSMAVQMESEMQTAMDNEEYFVVYQPQICLKTGKLKGIEALLRWNSPTRGLVAPNSFIPLAEETGMIVQLGEWCLRTACKEAVELQKRLGYPITLAVNVSPKQARAKGFRDVVQSALEDSGLQPGCLEVEITEGLLISHEDEALVFIASLQELGVSVAMDDFGMGFSNLSYITRFRVDRLKIDRSFVGRCTEDQSSKMVTTSILFLAKSLGIEVVAEGVETEEQASMLASLDCEIAQGFLYSRPTTADEIYKRAQQFTPPKPMTSVAAPLGAVGHLRAAGVNVRTPFPTLPSTNGPAKANGRTERKEPLFTGGTSRAFLDTEPRDPVCRPARPPRKAGAARVSIRTVEDESETMLLARTPQGPQFRLLQ